MTILYFLLIVILITRVWFIVLRHMQDVDMGKYFVGQAEHLKGFQEIWFRREFDIRDESTISFLFKTWLFKLAIYIPIGLVYIVLAVIIQPAIPMLGLFNILMLVWVLINMKNRFMNQLDSVTKQGIIKYQNPTSGEELFTLVFKLTIIVLDLAYLLSLID